jgi:hypothetical protein
MTRRVVVMVEELVPFAIRGSVILPTIANMLRLCLRASINDGYIMEIRNSVFCIVRCRKVGSALHKNLEEMVQELVLKSNLLDAEIKALVQVDDVKKIDVAAVLRRADLLALVRVFPIGEMTRIAILANSIRASMKIIHPQVASLSDESRLERHHGRMSNGLNSVVHLDRDGLNTIDKKGDT